MIIYAIHYPWEGPQMLFATRQGAEDALANDPMFKGNEEYYIVEWTVMP